MSKNIYSASKYLINLCLLLQDERQLTYRNLWIIFLLFGWCSLPLQKKRYGVVRKIMYFFLISKSVFQRPGLNSGEMNLLFLLLKTKPEDSYKQCQAKHHATPLVWQKQTYRQEHVQCFYFLKIERPGFLTCLKTKPCQTQSLCRHFLVLCLSLTRYFAF